jgi:hypothetical protein
MMTRTSKSFKLSNFLALQSRVQIARVAETERHLFLVKRIITLSPSAHTKLGVVEHVSSHRFLLLPSNLLLSFSTARCSIPALHSISEETAHDLPPVNLQADNDAKSDSEAESVAPETSSSPTPGAIKMADKKVPAMSDFFKKTSVTDAERQSYHDFGWLTGNLTSTILEVDVPTVNGSTILCFESYLIVGMGLLPTNFLSLS